jgi:hypothetical protein
MYGVSEIIAPLALMVVAYFPHRGPVGFGVTYVPRAIGEVLASGAVPIFASVYAFVRGWDNIVTGLREPNI